MLKIYTYPRSRSLRVLWVLEEIGVSYETIRVDFVDQGEGVRSPHPRGKVPFFVDGSVSIEEMSTPRYITVFHRFILIAAIYQR